MTGSHAQQSVSGNATKFVVRDVLFDVVRFPVWWYSTGTMNAFRLFGNEVQSVMDRLSIRILFRNLLKPMYGDTSRSGRAISFFMRLIVFIFRMVGLVLWLGVLLIGLVLWLGVLPVLVYQIVMQIIG